MEILGRGMIARALHLYQQELPDVVVFARGVSNSSEDDGAAYHRECDLLIEAIDYCKTKDKRLVYFSSAGTIYGNYPHLRFDDSPTLPATSYGRHQLLCEALIHGGGVRYCVVRLANLVGSNQNPHQLIPSLIRQAIAGQITLHKNATRDLLDVDDFARLLMQLLGSLQHTQNETVIIASGQSVGIMDLFAEIKHLLKLNPEIILLEKGDVQRFSLAKLRRLLHDELIFKKNYPQSVIAKYLKAYHTYEFPD